MMQFTEKGRNKLHEAYAEWVTDYTAWDKSAVENDALNDLENTPFGDLTHEIHPDESTDGRPHIVRFDGTDIVIITE